MKSFPRGQTKRGIALIVATLAGVAVTAVPKPARADAVSAAMTAIGVAQKLYSAKDWLNCKLSMVCLDSEAHIEATRVLTADATLILQIDSNHLIADFRSLFDDSDRFFRNPATTTAQNESDLISTATNLFYRFQTTLLATDATNKPQVDAAYNLTPYFVMTAALVDSIGQVTLAHGRAAIDLTWINDKRAKTLEVLEALVGAQSLWYGCSSVAPVSSVASLDGSFPTRKLWRRFADAQFYQSSCGNNCNLARHFDAVPSPICKHDCSFICQACVLPPDDDLLITRSALVKGQMARDAVVQSVRSDMEMLVKMGAMHNSALLWKQTAFPQAGLISAWDVWSDSSYRETKFGTPSSVWLPIVTGDFDGDGYDDIFWADKTDGVVSEWNIRENQTIAPGWGPSGGGSLPSFMYTPTTNTSKVFSGDLDGDGVSDIIFATTKFTQIPQLSYVLTWFMTPGTIVPKMTSTTTSIDPLQGVGNFDGDAQRRSDLLFRSSKGVVSVALNGGATVPLTIGGAAIGPVTGDWVIKDTADFNKDGKSDILWYNTTSGQTSIWFLNGSAVTGWPGISTTAPSSGWRVQAAADIDHDGVSDIVWEQTYGNAAGGGPVTIWLMNANATIRDYGASESVPSGGQFIGVLKQGLGTLPNVPGLLTNPPNASIPEQYCGNASGTLRNPGFAGYETWESGATFDGGHGTLVGDVNGDGKAELVTLGSSRVTGMGLVGNAFSPVANYWGGAFYGSRGNFLVDFDGDGAADLVGLGDGYVGLLLSLGIHGTYSTGYFGDYRTALSASFFGQLGTLMGDVDGDGKADLVDVNQTNILMRRSLGTTLADATMIQNRTSWGAANFLVDVDGDGKADLVTVTASTVYVSISAATWLGDPVAWSPAGWNLGTHGVSMADVDGDGRADLIMPTDGYVSVLRSTGAAFGAEEVWNSGGAFYGNHGTFAADFDGNSRADLIGVGDGYVGAIRSQ